MSTAYTSVLLSILLGGGGLGCRGSGLFMAEAFTSGTEAVDFAFKALSVLVLLSLLYLGFSDVGGKICGTDVRVATPFSIRIFRRGRPFGSFGRCIGIISRSCAVGGTVRFSICGRPGRRVRGCFSIRFCSCSPMVGLDSCGRVLGLGGVSAVRLDGSRCFLMADGSLLCGIRGGGSVRGVRLADKGRLGLGNVSAGAC